MPQTSAATDSNLQDANSTPSTFACVCRNSGLGAIWIYATGELDQAAASELDRVLTEAQAHALLVVLDLGDLESIDGTGIDVILRASARAQRMALRLVLVRGPSRLASA